MVNAAKTDRVMVQSSLHAELIDVTERVERVVSQSGVVSGLCHVYVPHTTAGVLVNENADPDVLSDFLTTLERLIPWDNGYRHAEGNAAAHIKSTLVGTSQTVPVRAGRLALGRWQGIYFAEFDGPRERHLQVTVLA
ncbi:MAG TPA: secondary thiamine-phosphate synthase enzyme YjbQ [Candidatus Dormibacteraeota bacterium]|nr:secondary thiamine-phosphate synthase enzyme YjbQ [Candidatus Dormibacteraeota bacterium]